MLDLPTIGSINDDNNMHDVCIFAPVKIISRPHLIPTSFVQANSEGGHLALRVCSFLIESSKVIFHGIFHGLSKGRSVDSPAAELIPVLHDFQNRTHVDECQDI